MRCRKALFLSMPLLLAGSHSLWAQDAAAPVKEVASSSNMLAIMMIIISLVLAFVIYAMGQVLVTLIRQVMDKKNESGKILSVLLVVIFSLAGAVTQAQDNAAEEVVKVVPNYGGLDATAFWMLVIVIAVEVIAILVILLFIKSFQNELMPAKTRVKSIALKDWWARVDKKLFTKAVPIEKEADILLDHDYDGIKELDNSLPPWWKYGFVITIFFSMAYLLHFHVLGSGKNPTQEYEAEMQNAKAQMEIYAAKSKDKIDEDNIVMAEAAGIAEGREIFEQVCWACHGKAGEGGAGPNLTDDNWMHKGSLNDIYYSIKMGYPDKGMQAWEKQYSPKQISNITSYVKLMRGTNPVNPKAPEGDLYTDMPVADSTLTIAKDSSKTK